MIEFKEKSENEINVGKDQPKKLYKSISEKKKDDTIQQQIFMENRRKALERLREYKQVFFFFILLHQLKNNQLINLFI